MNHSYHPSDRLRFVINELDPKLLRVLCDLARLYVCMQWAKQDARFLGEHPEPGIDLVADADVAFNWAFPDEERSMMRLFDSALIGNRLSEYIGRWLFVSSQRELPATRMYQGHAREVHARVQSAQADITDEARLISERILQRDRPFNSLELEEIESFINEAEIETGFTMRSEFEDVYGEVAQSRASRAGGMKLSHLLRSQRVRPMARDWIDETVGDRSFVDDDVTPAYEAWRTALTRAGFASEAAIDTDAAALAYVSLINECVSARHRARRVVFLTGSARIYRAASLLLTTRDAGIFSLRHPLCFLFTSYSPKVLSATRDDGKEWTAYGNVFESFLSRLIGPPYSSDAVFGAAYHLAWLRTTSESHDSPPTSNTRSSEQTPAWIIEHLNGLQDTGMRLVTAQALSLRAEQLAETHESQRRNESSASSAGRGSQRLPVELDLLHKLRYLETSSVDGLLRNLVSGVLSNSLKTPGSARQSRERWRKVPILVFGPKDDLFQEFAISLRSDPDPLLSSDALRPVRDAARNKRSRYLSLVLDALILAAFGEWAAAASMSRRAVERAEYFAEDSETRLDFDRFGRSEEGRLLHDELLDDIRDIDGREARYLCSHSIRYSAHSLKEFEVAALHLRAFRETVPDNDIRGRSEDLALGIAEWTFLKYVEQSPNIGRLKSLHERLERAHIDFDEEWHLSKQTGTNPDVVRAALVKFVREQSMLNLALVLLESSLHKLPLGNALVEPVQFSETIAKWGFGETNGTSLFARFVAGVTCLHFAPDSAEKWCRSTRRQLHTDIANFSRMIPADGVAYERLRARAYVELVEERVTTRH